MNCTTMCLEPCADTDFGPADIVTQLSERADIGRKIIPAAGNHAHERMYAVVVRENAGYAAAIYFIILDRTPINAAPYTLYFSVTSFSQ